MKKITKFLTYSLVISDLLREKLYNGEFKDLYEKRNENYREHEKQEFDLFFDLDHEDTLGIRFFYEVDEENHRLNIKFKIIGYNGNEYYNDNNHSNPMDLLDEFLDIFYPKYVDYIKDFEYTYQRKFDEYYERTGRQNPNERALNFN